VSSLKRRKLSADNRRPLNAAKFLPRARRSHYAYGPPSHIVRRPHYLARAMFQWGAWERIVSRYDEHASAIRRFRRTYV
jgi:hypothetical protein